VSAVALPWRSGLRPFLTLRGATLPLLPVLSLLPLPLLLLL
jgi:hypothetical protein